MKSNLGQGYKTPYRPPPYGYEAQSISSRNFGTKSAMSGVLHIRSRFNYSSPPSFSSIKLISSTTAQHPTPWSILRRCEIVKFGARYVCGRMLEFPLLVRSDMFYVFCCVSAHGVSFPLSRGGILSPWH